MFGLAKASTVRRLAKQLDVLYEHVNMLDDIARAVADNPNLNMSRAQRSLLVDHYSKFRRSRNKVEEIAVGINEVHGIRF